MCSGFTPNPNVCRNHCQFNTEEQGWLCSGTTDEQWEETTKALRICQECFTTFTEDVNKHPSTICPECDTFYRNAKCK
jgi:hypothetical protein